LQRAIQRFEVGFEGLDFFGEREDGGVNARGRFYHVVEPEGELEDAYTVSA
jgi:hypothetical protein